MERYKDGHSYQKSQEKRGENTFSATSPEFLEGKIVSRKITALEETLGEVRYPTEEVISLLEECCLEKRKTYRRRDRSITTVYSLPVLYHLTKKITSAEEKKYSGDEVVRFGEVNGKFYSTSAVYEWTDESRQTLRKLYYKHSAPKFDDDCIIQLPQNCVHITPRKNRLIINHAPITTITTNVSTCEMVEVQLPEKTKVTHLEFMGSFFQCDYLSRSKRSSNSVVCVRAGPDHTDYFPPSWVSSVQVFSADKLIDTLSCNTNEYGRVLHDMREKFVENVSTLRFVPKTPFRNAVFRVNVYVRVEASEWDGENTQDYSVCVFLDPAKEFKPRESSRKWDWKKTCKFDRVQAEREQEK